MSVKKIEMTGGAETTITPLVYANASMPEFNTERDNWAQWKERLEIHFEEVNCEEEKQKKATLLRAIGTEAYSVIRSLCDPVIPVKKSYEELCELLYKHYMPTVILFRERKTFFAAEKTESESIASWLARLKKLALNCKFGVSLEQFVLNKFISGTSGPIFERFCEEDENLNLADAYRKALVVESKILSRTVNNGSSSNDIMFIKGQKKRGDSNKTNKKTKKPCVHCGWKNHQSSSCKFKKSVCHSCNKVGHLASICNQKDRAVHFIDKSTNQLTNKFNESNSDFSIFSIESVNSEMVVHRTDSDVNMSQVYVLPVLINGVKLDMTCDTGAPLSLMSVGFFDQFYKRRELKSCGSSFTSYGGNSIEVIGEFDTIVNYKGQERLIKFVVTNTVSPPLLGRNFLREFNFKLIQTRQQINAIDDSLISKEESLKKEFSEVFNGKLGKYNLGTVKLECVSEAKTVFCKPRPIPLAWKKTIENQLKDLVEKDVLEPIDNSDWGTPLVPIVKPNGEIRICGDYKSTINKFLIDFKYPLPRIEEIFASLQGGQLFTKLDLSNAYNQLVLDEDSQKLCAWSTHIGVFKMKRLPFGVKPAAAIFQKTIEILLKNMTNVTNYIDDIVVTGKNLDEHVRNLRIVLKKLQTAGLKLNIDKCAFFQKKISYLGFNIDQSGLSKNKSQIESVVSAPVPSNITELRAFIGMVNYYSRFISNYAHKMAPLYELLQKEKDFKWNNSCQKAYELMKIEVTSDQVLIHFNPRLPIVLSTDASQNAVAGVLSHIMTDNTLKPVAFVSRALSKSEKNYSTIEKEALAIIFSVTKLRQYLLGVQFELHTDHKPLLAIFGENRGLPVMAAARMQRWAFILSGFVYNLKHVKGIQNLADSLSRMPHKENNESLVESNYINYVGFDNQLLLNFKNIAIETRKDPILSKLLESINLGVVHKLKEPHFEAFKNKQKELTVEAGCILWGYRTIVPSKLRDKVLAELHKSHLGIVKTKTLARSYIWWPKLDSEIEAMVKRCHACQLTQASPEKSILFPWVPTDAPWKRIHLDFAGPIKGFQVLVIIDSFSKWVEVYITKRANSKFVVSKLREIFCRFGLVDVIVTDNGTQFTSDEFKSFVANNRIKHVLTAPGHPATNGQAENLVKTLKKSLYASLKDNGPDDIKDMINRFLFDYRNTKHSTTNETPAKLLIGRELKTRFSLLKPPIIKETIQNNQLSSAKNHKGKRNVELKENQNVYIRDYTDPNNSAWTKAKIKKKLGPCNYTCVITHNNRPIKRHVNQIRGQKDEPNSLVDIDSQDRDEGGPSDPMGTESTIMEDPKLVEDSEYEQSFDTADDEVPSPKKLRPRKHINYSK